MNIFVINLKKDFEKRQSITQQLNNLGLPFKMVDAVNGKSIPDNELKKFVFKPELDFLTKGEIGCALSHQKIYKEMIERNIDYVIVLEDDVKISTDFFAFMNNFFNFTKNRKIKNEVFLLQKSKNYFKNKKIQISEKYYFTESYNPKGTYGYIISKEAAKCLLDINSPLILEADHWLAFYELSLLKVYSLNSGLVVLNKKFEKKSSIEIEREQRGGNSSGNIKKEFMKSRKKIQDYKNLSQIY